MRQYKDKGFWIETPSQLKALYELRRGTCPKVHALAQVWGAEAARITSAQTGGAKPIFRVYLLFETEFRWCSFVRIDAQGKHIRIGELPYNSALRYCRENNLKLMEPEVTK